MPSFVIFERTADGWDPLAVVQAPHARRARALACERFPDRDLRAQEVHRVEAGDVLRAEYRGRVRQVGGNGRRRAPLSLLRRAVARVRRIGRR